MDGVVKGAPLGGDADEIEADTARFVARNREQGAAYFDEVYEALPDDNDDAFDEARIQLAVKITRMLYNPECGYNPDKIDAIHAADAIINWHIKTRGTDAEPPTLDMAEGLAVAKTLNMTPDMTEAPAGKTWATQDAHEAFARRFLADGTFQGITDKHKGLVAVDMHKWIASVRADVDALIADEADHFDGHMLLGMMFRLGAGEETAMPIFSDFECHQYGVLTNWAWYQTHPWWPRDGRSHTSDVCRSIANQIVAFVKTLPEAAVVIQ
jgi:hypothetical protein